MTLRDLQPQDAPLMLEWMHDEELVRDMQANFAQKTIGDCRAFIAQAGQDPRQLHRAVADEDGTYLGTVSLKNIDREAARAEFAIAMRRCATGQGVSRYAMAEIFRVGFEELGLQEIYWCASRNNRRAMRFYEKGGYRPSEPDARGLVWYCAAKSEWERGATV